MDKRILQTYSTWAKENLEIQIEVSLKALGINDDTDIKKAKRVGDFTVIEGDDTTYPADMLGKRNHIVSLVDRMGYRNVIEEFAYTWFNRFVALRFMEVHGYLSHGFRVLSNPRGGIEPEILKNINLVAAELKLDMKLCTQYKQHGKIEELYRHVLLRQCNALAGILPMLFSADYEYLELLLPKTLLKGETVITRLVEIPEESFLEDVEIIGWMYQFYISFKKDAVYASKKTITKYTLPAVTQLFTPDWIVRYMAENSVGRLWLESYPNSSLRSEMKYYVDDAEQTAEVQKKIDEIKYKNVNPEKIRIIEPCCGSGHILVYVFDLLYKMYEERGYQKRDIPTMILKNNLVGLDVDKRAVQLASFSLVMKARSVNNRYFNDNYYEAPHVYELQDSKLLKELGYRRQLHELNLLSDKEIDSIAYLVDTFENGKTIGSLIKVDSIDFLCIDKALDTVANSAVASLFNTDFLNYGLKRLKELLNLSKVLYEKYDVMLTNPPYRGVTSMEECVKQYALDYYPDSKTDFFAMFIERAKKYVNSNGFAAFLTPYVWMFIQSYEKLRNHIYTETTIESLIQFEYSAFEEATVPICTFTLRNHFIDRKKGCFFRLTAFRGGMDIQREKTLEAINSHDCGYYYEQAANKFYEIPGAPVTYWASDVARAAYIYPNMDKIAQPRHGLATSDNNRFLKLWHEVDINKTSLIKRCELNKKWFPMSKGGNFRRWYGNLEWIINYENDGKEIKDYAISIYRCSSRTIQNTQFYFKTGLTWSALTSGGFSVRLQEAGALFGSGGYCAFTDPKTLYYILALLNSKATGTFISYVSPTINYEVGHIKTIPVVVDESRHEMVDELVESNILLSREEWDSFETSWDFKQHPMIKKAETVLEAFSLWSQTCSDRFSLLKKNEELLNEIFIDIYGLQEELTPKVEDKEVTVRLADKERDIRSLISYLIGIVMGRYSLDVPGLAYAGGDWDASKYQTYQPDDDGIVPIYTKLGMEDGLTTKLIELIKSVYGEDTYRQNIDFIAEALGKKNNESSEETLNRYLNDGFYSDHLKIYQKRPIYWMFSSGKKAGFKCLIYMHRYNEDTLARINAKYYLPESTRKKNELDELNGRITKAEGRDKLRLEKERQNLAAAYNEALEYGQVLDHMANQYIAIDLDDGVKVNYAKFQGVQLVTDSGTKVKKDLLVPLK